MPAPLPAAAVVDLIHSCWAKDPSQRPTAEQVVQRLQALVGPEVAGLEGSEGSAPPAGPSTGSASSGAAAPAPEPPTKPQPKARPANPFLSGGGARLFA